MRNPESLPIPSGIATAADDAVTAIGEAGDHWTGAERVAVASVARHAFAHRHSPPWMRPPAPAVDLDDDVVATVSVLAADATTLDRDWAEATVERLGAGAYVELVSLCATTAIVDAFAEALGVDPAPLPAPQPGAPAEPSDQDRGYAVDDIGAYVPMRVPWSDANVGRALTLSPAGNRLYRDLSGAFYHDGQFYDLVWKRQLSRPQAEVLATAVSAANECFY